MKFNFCEVCGAKAGNEWLDSYNPETGEKNFRSVCSVDPCHTGHDERCMPFTFRLWGPDWKCARCGETGYWAEM